MMIRTCLLRRPLLVLVGCLFLGALCNAQALAIAEFCPAVLGDPHVVADGGGSLYSTTLTAQAARTVTAEGEAQTENGWYAFSIPATAIAQQAVRYATPQLTFTRNEPSSSIFYVRFPEGAGKVQRWWITYAQSSGDTLMGWDAKGKVGCPPYAHVFGPRPSPNPALYAQFAANRISPPALDYDRMPGSEDVVLAAAASAGEHVSCDKPFDDSSVKHAVAPQWPIGYSTTVDLETLVRVDINADGSLADAWIFQPSGAKAFDDAALTAARQSKYAPGRALCQPAPGEYIFRALFRP